MLELSAFSAMPFSYTSFICRNFQLTCVWCSVKTALQGCRYRGGGDACPPYLPDSGSSVNLISTGGGADYAHQLLNAPTRFSDLPTSLHWMQQMHVCSSTSKGFGKVLIASWHSKVTSSTSFSISQSISCDLFSDRRQAHTILSPHARSTHTHLCTNYVCVSNLF
jgi:hypothetical protein